MHANPISSYTRAIRAALPADTFLPAPSRLVWLAFHIAVIAAGTWIIAAGWGGWPVWLALSLVIGHSFAGLAFVGHELLHGAIVRSKQLRYVLGGLCFVPFIMSPRLWVAWHNRVHHGHTMAAGVDPDAYPTLEAYLHSPLLRVVDRFSPAAGRILGGLSLIIGFSFQSLHVLLRVSRINRYLSPRELRWARLETLAGLVGWSALAWFIGPLAFLFAFVIPILLANVVIMAYILTNHSLSPLTEVNDPLLNTLSVTTPRIVSFLHLGFGLHVEHHLFPAMSARHSDAVRKVLVRMWPGRYQSMPFGRALWRLFSTPRVYKDAVTLIDPRNGSESPTLLPV